MKSAMEEGVNPAEDSACLMIAHQLAFILDELYKEENVDCAEVCSAEEALSLATLLKAALISVVERRTYQREDAASKAICRVLCSKLRIRQVDIDYFDHIDRVNREVASDLSAA